ncbi:type II toxin-antitoxin system VapC family toxin [Shinella oryzae]|uniref:type II toxin-antitoxin system VapC family toxin n=1 Tax=Shinella oryzae TaxID=2871820 RepID=UPI001FF607C7|nr:type II toxin-antitoxin system VapC family toxin [Shinella oryzae]UPA26476.1 type II toxin-antitoxin system VapC family toxin [Shinella oryzae]
MFVDASAIVAMMTNEDDARSLGQRLVATDRRLTSPMAIWEAAVAYARVTGLEPKAALGEVEAYLRLLQIETLAVDAAITAADVEAFQRFGKGRHPAALNFGDCFAYACARQHGIPLLYKGDDFARTDIDTA